MYVSACTLLSSLPVQTLDWAFINVMVVIGVAQLL